MGQVCSQFSLLLSFVMSQWFTVLQIHLLSGLITFVFALIPSMAASLDTTELPSQTTSNLTLVAAYQNDSYSIEPAHKLSVDPGDSESSLDSVSHRLNAGHNNDIPVVREFPLALVIASSVAAFLILVFFVIAYCWHTHQLDSRAKKLAIRIAADSELHGGMCHSCSPPSHRGGLRRTYDRIIVPASPDQDSIEYGEIPQPSRDTGETPGSPDGGRSLGLASELSDAGDSEDMEQHERGRSISRGSRGSHRKWSRSRKSSSGDNSKRRDSAITDKAILSHFASRRHSTFFI